jgi:hypothetical protein
MKQLAFLSISSTSSLKNIAQNSKPLILANQLIFTSFHISTLLQDEIPRGGGEMISQRMFECPLA